MVIELERLFLPIGHAGRQVGNLVDSWVFLKQAVGRHGVMQEQEPRDRQAHPHPRSITPRPGLCGLGLLAH